MMNSKTEEYNKMCKEKPFFFDEVENKVIRVFLFKWRISTGEEDQKIVIASDELEGWTLIESRYNILRENNVSFEVDDITSLISDIKYSWYCHLKLKDEKDAIWMRDIEIEWNLYNVTHNFLKEYIDSCPYYCKEIELYEPYEEKEGVWLDDLRMFKMSEDDWADFQVTCCYKGENYSISEYMDSIGL